MLPGLTMSGPAILLAVAWFCAFAFAADPVCIIGAGPAGLTVANRLQAKGVETVIFDKNPEVGGKCQAYYDDSGLFHPMGAILFSNESYPETLAIINSVGVPSAPFGRTSLWAYEWRTGHVQQSPPLSSLTNQPLFMAEIARYTQFWNTEFAPTMSIGYKNGVEGYTMSTFDWLIENDYPLLLLLFVNGMVPYGYGDVTQTPIIYMLTYMTPDILLFFADQRVGYVIDFHQVFVRYAADHVTGPIYLNSSITNIDRSGDLPSITYIASGATAPSVQSCSKLVLAFPPVMHALQAANLDISAEEETVFSPVGIIKYWSGAVSVATPDGMAFVGFLRKEFLGLINRLLNEDDFPFDEFIPFLPEAAGQPVAFLRLFDASDVATTYSWGKYRSHQTIGHARTLLKRTISRLNKDPRNATATPIPITDDDIKDFKEWDYFPHYDQPQLDQGYYAKFNELQGWKNTYYASGFNAFETVEFAIRAGIDVVDTYFD